MRQRIITGLIGAAAVVLLLLSSLDVISVAVALVSIYALHEMYGAIGIKDNKPLYITGLLFSAALYAVELYIPQFTMLLLFSYVVVMFCILLLNHKQIKVTDIALCLFMTVYIVYTMLHITFVRALPYGKISIFLIFIGAFGTDTFAYFVGVTCGKKKLCPEISPKKTVEGAVGGIVGDVLCFAVTGLVLKFAFSINVSYIYLMVLGLLCGVFSEIGDLAASMIKRQYGVKDYGNLLPGHGGIMDRLDSIIFVAPLVYYFIKNLPVLG